MHGFGLEAAALARRRQPVQLLARQRRRLQQSDAAQPVLWDIPRRNLRRFHGINGGPAPARPRRRRAVEHDRILGDAAQQRAHGAQPPESVPRRAWNQTGRQRAPHGSYRDLAPRTAGAAPAPLGLRQAAASPTLLPFRATTP